jgi:hypothetical protein
MPHDPDAPFEMSSGFASATQSCNNDTQSLPPMRSPTPLSCGRGVLFGY